MSITSLIRMCMENESDTSKPDVETEATIYAKMTDPSGLENADDFEQHEQLEGYSVEGGRFRCRKTTRGDDVKYVLTLKVKNHGVGIAGIDGNLEYNVEVDEAFYNGFKNVSKKRLVKTRYVFHGKGTSLDSSPETILPPVKYEVDVFKKLDGCTSEWVKIDIELDKVIFKLKESGKDINDSKLRLKISHLDFKPVEGFIADQASPEQKEILDHIWENEFNLPVNNT